MENKGQILKSIGFPIPELSIVDRYVFLQKESRPSISRSSTVIDAVREYIVNHRLEDVTGLKLK